jgi:hypothetical protein
MPRLASLYERENLIRSYPALAQVFRRAIQDHFFPYRAYLPAFQLR